MEEVVQKLVLEISNEKEIVWEFTSNDNSAGWYRAFRVPDLHPEAFSVKLERYSSFFMDEHDLLLEAVILDNSNTLSFKIFNENGFNQIYNYQLINVNDNFIEHSAEVNIGPWSQLEVNQIINVNGDNIIHPYSLIIEPRFHKYNKKTKNFNVYKSQETLSHDSNLKTKTFK